MDTISFRQLTDVNFALLHATFLEVFKNYYVPMQCPQEVLAMIFAKNGVDYTLSFGAFDRDKLVGFTCVATGNASVMF